MHKVLPTSAPKPLSTTTPENHNQIFIPLCSMPPLRPIRTKLQPRLKPGLSSPGPSGRSRAIYNALATHSPSGAGRRLPRKQFKARHGALDIRVFERVGVVLFHPGDLVDPIVCFKHVDDESVVGAMVDRVSGQPVT
jgi:hypothetical protein